MHELATKLSCRARSPQGRIAVRCWGNRRNTDSARLRYEFIGKLSWTLLSVDRDRFAVLYTGSVAFPPSRWRLVHISWAGGLFDFPKLRRPAVVLAGGA